MDARIIADGTLFERFTKLTWGILNSLKEHERSPEVPGIARFATDLAAMQTQAVGHLQNCMRGLGQFHPRLAVHSRRFVAVVAFDNIPEDIVVQAALASCIAVMLRKSPAASYWLASECWFADYDSPDAAVRQLEPAKREDKREGVLLSLANRREHRLVLLETQRAADGGLTLLERGMARWEVGLLFDNLFAPKWR
jgi:hypothetical protein